MVSLAGDNSPERRHIACAFPYLVCHAFDTTWVKTLATSSGGAAQPTDCEVAGRSVRRGEDDGRGDLAFVWLVEPVCAGSAARLRYPTPPARDAREPPDKT